LNKKPLGYNCRHQRLIKLDQFIWVLLLPTTHGDFVAFGHRAHVDSHQWNARLVADYRSNWDVATAAKPTILKAHHEAVQQVLWADDGSRLGSKSVDGQIIIWDAEQGRKISTFSRFDNGLAAAIASSMPDVETVSLNALPSGKGCSKYQMALNNTAN